jgi:serine/threonine protein phosphatase PrpC
VSGARGVDDEGSPGGPDGAAAGSDRRGTVVTLVAPGMPSPPAADLPAWWGRCGLVAQSHRGARARNEDRMGVWSTPSATLLALADGMGGHPQGDVAADSAVRTLGRRFAEEASPELVVPRTFLPSAFLDAQDDLLAYGRELGGADQPRTTLVAALIQEGHLWWSHCGDSRLYLVRQGQVLVRTRDHSFAELNALLEADTDLSPPVSRNVLFSCIGSLSRPVVDSAGPLALMPGDRLLLCSDGLWEGLEETALVAELTRSALASGVAGLAQRALHLGGARCDNVTLMAMSWDADHPPSP